MKEGRLIVFAHVEKAVSIHLNFEIFKSLLLLFVCLFLGNFKVCDFKRDKMYLRSTKYVFAISICSTLVVRFFFQILVILLSYYLLFVCIIFIYAKPSKKSSSTSCIATVSTIDFLFVLFVLLTTVTLFIFSRAISFSSSSLSFSTSSLLLSSSSSSSLSVSLLLLELLELLATEFSFLPPTNYLSSSSHLDSPVILLTQYKRPSWSCCVHASSGISHCDSPVRLFT